MNQKPDLAFCEPTEGLVGRTCDGCAQAAIRLLTEESK